jgi:signal transduction histidine kinase
MPAAAEASTVAAVRELAARRWIDGFVVVLAVVAQVEVWTQPAEIPRPVAAVAALAWTLPLLARRRFPLAAPATVFATLGLESLLSGQVVTSSGVNPFALFAAFAIAGTHADQRAALVGGAIGYASMATIVLIDDPPSEDVVGIFLVSAAVWAIGRALAEPGRRADELQQRAERLEREQQTAALEERARIARELRDVIAHSVSVMTVQAGAARVLLTRTPSGHASRCSPSRRPATRRWARCDGCWGSCVARTTRRRWRHSRGRRSSTR